MKRLIKKYKQLALFDKILIFLAVFAISFFGYILFRRSEYLEVVIKVNEENTRYEQWRQETGTMAWFAELFYEGMSETDGLGRVMAEILEMRSYDTKPGRKVLYLKTRINAVYSKSSDQYTFKGRPLLIGSTIKLNLDNLLVEGLVTQVEGVDDPRLRETIVVEAQVKEETFVFPETSGVRVYVADALSIGEEIKDSQGNTILKILDKKTENAKRLVTTSDGRVIVQTNPLRRDVYLTLEITAYKIGGRYYIFDDIPILIGETIPINTPTISVWPEITSIGI